MSDHRPESPSLSETTENESALMSVDQICEAIRDAAEDAIQTKDFISYATVLDVHLSEPDRYNDEERVKLLKELHSVLLQHDILVEQVGWDLPWLLVGFLSRDYSVTVSTVPGVKNVMDMFSLIATKGNPKEVFLKSIECLTSLRVEDDEEDDEEEEKKNNEAQHDNDERTFDVKFYALYQLMFYSLKRIETNYPSRFLGTCTSALLSCFAVNMDDMSPMSLSVVVRRMFLFARDFEMVNMENASDKEIAAQQLILQSYVSWIADLAFQRFNIKWSNRLYIEIKNKCENASASVRKEKYRERVEVVNITECVERLAQLMMSFDIDLEHEMVKLITKDISTSENEEEEELFKGLSNDGLLILCTQYKFEQREPLIDLTFDQLLELGTKFLSRDDGALAPYGVVDAIMFWTLWVVKDVDTNTVQSVDKKKLFGFLQQLCAITVATTNDRELLNLINTSVAKILSLCKEDDMFEFMTDTFKHCPFEKVRESMIHMMKSFIVRRRVSHVAAAAAQASTPPKNPEDLAGELSKVKITEDNTEKATKSCPIMHTTSERLKSIQDVAMIDVESTVKEGLTSDKFGTLLSWLNFFTVVESSTTFIEDVVKQCKELMNIEADNDDEKRRQEILQLTIDRLNESKQN